MKKKKNPLLVQLKNCEVDTLGRQCAEVSQSYIDGIFSY